MTGRKARPKRFPALRTGPALLVGVAALAPVPAHPQSGTSAIAIVRHVSPVPLPGIPARLQSRSIGEAARLVRPGETVLIHTGVYREYVRIDAGGTPDRPVRFVAAPGARVVVTGADVLADWRKEPDAVPTYSAAWPHSFIDWGLDHTHAAPAPIGRAEQVFIEGIPLHQALARDRLGPGTFFVDLAAKRLYICPADNARGYEHTDLSRVTVEASARPLLWEVRGRHVHTRGIRFRYAANHAQSGAATFAGDDALVEDCVFERTNGEGAIFSGSRIVVRRCLFQDIGYEAFSANGAHGLRMSDCTVRNNNTKNFDRGWGGAGNKIVLSRNVVIERSSFLSNRGFGIWFDIGNENATVRNCLVADNELGGLFYEISYGLRAHDNVFLGNGWEGSYGSWGAVGGICISSSPGCVIERNILAGNKEGISFREQKRTTPRIGGGKAEVAVWNHDETLRNNLLAYNEIQLWGWFAQGDGRHWPAPKAAGPGGPARPEDDMAGRYLAKDATGQPTGLVLRDLRLTLENNVYCPGPGQFLFRWGPSWEKNRSFTDLAQVRKALGLEMGSVRAPVVFADYLSRNLRLPPSSPAVRRGCYPRGVVPGVRLSGGAGGAMEAADRHRGAGAKKPALLK